MGKYCVAIIITKGNEETIIKGQEVFANSSEDAVIKAVTMAKSDYPGYG